MTNVQMLITILCCSLATIIIRYLPFLVFSGNKPTPKIIQYLGKALPAAVFAMLLVYCLKNVDILSGSHGLPELIAIIITAALHLWRKNILLSIAVGTVSYMILIQFVFR